MSPVSAIRYTHEERVHALRALVAFAEEPRWKRARAEATATYFVGLPEDATAQEREEVRTHENVRNCLIAYSLADHVADDDQSIVMAFLASKRPLLLRRGGRTWLETFSVSTVSAYRVLDAVPGSHCRLEDLVTDEELEVYDRLGSQDCRPGMVLAARVMPRGDGKLGFDGDLLPLPGSAEELRELLQDWFYEESGLPPDEDGLLAFAKCLAPFLFEYWFEGTYRAADLVPVRVNGEVAELGVATFRMPAGASAELAFAHVADLEADGEDAWNYRPERDGKRVLIGRLVAHDGWLHLESIGRASMKSLRELAQRAFGGGLRHHSTRYEPPTLKRGERGTEMSWEQVPLDPAAVGVPPEHPEFQERARAALLAQHYGTWTQIPLPALEGRTPAQAASDPAWRARLLELIEDAERLERDDAARRGPSARAFDFGPIRTELGFAAREAEA